MRTITERAPAKLNLTLDILRKRPDGYHDLQMVMQTVSLYDTVTVQEREGGLCLVSTSFQLPEGKTMEQRAAEAFFAALGRPVPGLEIRLEKQIPAYAGMGGGSADVAALLRALRTLYAPDLTDDVLERIGLTVGSDVPFCIRGGTMLAEGRGEKLTPLPALPPCCILICGDLNRRKHINNFWVQDCSAAADHMLLEAEHLGLGAVWIGVYPAEERVEACARLFHTPDHVLPFCIIALGHPAEKPGPIDTFRPERIHYEDWNRTDPE